MSTNANKNQLFNFLSPDEQETFRRIEVRLDRNLNKLSAVYRKEKETPDKTTLRIQLENDKDVLVVLKQKAAIRKAKAEHLSKKIDREQYASLREKFVKK
ncbi:MULTISPECIES: hypothetical protein [unclassified Exiguobacterium]|uniref:hypothetical protein n=1 Tax=unclassified Exiguobacterium TaxID=2644629 RepID=UPI001BE90A8E|nr:MULTISPECIES: hypothetical protein [unclassified Exiguobacterium]